jgi:DNA-binding transcriptional regulator YdaS (Cro superfamily)
MNTALDKAIAQAGGVRSLARKLDISASAVSQWERVPVMRVLEVEEITAIPRHELRPDIYPDP